MHFLLPQIDDSFSLVSPGPAFPQKLSQSRFARPGSPAWEEQTHSGRSRHIVRAVCLNHEAGSPAEGGIGRWWVSLGLVRQRKLSSAVSQSRPANRSHTAGGILSHTGQRNQHIPLSALLYWLKMPGVGLASAEHAASELTTVSACYDIRGRASVAS